jgi:hypothetical protein
MEEKGVVTKQIKKKKKIRCLHEKASYNEIFVKRDGHISRYTKRVHELFAEGYAIPLSLIPNSIPVVLIHGLQATILKCVQIALEI